MLTAVAAGLSAVAVFLFASGRTNLVRVRLLPRRTPREASRHLVPAAVLVGGAIVGGLLGGPVGAAAGLAVLPIGRLVRQRRARKQESRRTQAAVADACISLAADVDSGRSPILALDSAAAEWPALFAMAAGRAAIGGDIPDALRQSVRHSGATAMPAIAAAWQVSEQTGAGLSDALICVGDALRDEAATAREAESQLASVRVTARLMAFLPIGTLGLFSASNDGEPLDFLLHTPPGLGCLVGAFGLVAAGLWWVERLTGRATASAWSQ